MTQQLQGMSQDVSPIFRMHLQSVRLFMRDFSELNILTRGEESSDRMIAWASLDFCSDYNGTPPFSMFGVEDFYSVGLQSFAVRGTTISLLQSLMILYTRNRLPFSDGGISGVLNDQADMIMRMLSLLQSSYEQNKRMIKTAMNLQQLLEVNSTGLFSDYSVLSQFAYLG